MTLSKSHFNLIKSSVVVSALSSSLLFLYPHSITTKLVGGIILYLLSFISVSLIYNQVFDLSKSICLSLGLFLGILTISGLLVNIIGNIGHDPHPLNIVSIHFVSSFLMNIIICLLNKRKLKFDILNKVIAEMQTTLKLIVLLLLNLILAIFGIIYLNNTGINLLIILCEIINILFLLSSLLFESIRKRYSPIILFFFSLINLLLVSLRSNYITGTDIFLEYQVFSNTFINNNWLSNQIKTIYSQCLSITILPSVLNYYLNINLDYIFKIVFPVIISFIPVIIYRILCKYTSKFIALLGTVIFMSYPSYYLLMPMHIRGAIAVFYLSLFIMITLDKIQDKYKVMLLMLFGILLITSHYSSSYLFLLTIWIFSLIYITFKLILTLRQSNNTRSNLSVIIHNSPIIPMRIVLSLTIFVFIYWFQLLPYPNNVTALIHSTVKNINKAFSSNFINSQANIFQQLNIFYIKPDISQKFNSLITATSLEYQNYERDFYQQDNKPIQILQDIVNPNKINYRLINAIYLVFNINNKILKIIFVVGVILIILDILHFNNLNTIDYQIKILALSSVIVLFLCMILPNISFEYGVSRVYQQLLVINIFIYIFSMNKIGNMMKNYGVKTILLVLIFNYLILYNGLASELFGGNYPSYLYNNYGSLYDRFYLHESELLSANWLKRNMSAPIKVIADDPSSKKIQGRANINSLFKFNLLSINLIPKKSYIYLSNSNVNYQFAYSWVEGEPIKYSIALSDFYSVKNTIYNNHNSNILE